MSDVAIYEPALREQLPAFAQVLPRDLAPERLMRTVLVSIERVPELQNCSLQSVLNSAMSAAVLGLEVDGFTGQGFLIPFAGKAQLVVGYKGYATIAARGRTTISGEVVREGDSFEYELGTGAFVRHRPRLGHRGDIIGAWALAASHDRPPVVAVMGIDELLATKAKSAGARRRESPWNEPEIGFPAMCSKTVKRRLARSLPLLPYLRAAALDGAAEAGKSAWLEPDGTLVVDGEASPLPTRSEPPADLLQWEQAPCIQAIGPNGRRVIEGWMRQLQKVATAADLDRFAEESTEQRAWFRNSGSAANREAVALVDERVANLRRMLEG